ncbi:ATP-binding protein, partial [Candidatus Saccharibacteria bacterium]|nr:ATP-binding protein [Candidatus Saccharibacteria bacterium]
STSLARGTITEVHLQPPLRAPHHTASLSSVIGGGRNLQPGDISLAHKGVLLLDELPEYPRSHLESLRQPLENRQITLSRPGYSTTYPADFLLVATMNPCPCGYFGDPLIACRCGAAQLANYQKKLSGPLMDRVALRLTVAKPDHEQLFDPDSLTENQQLTVLKSINTARGSQFERYNRRDYYNAYATSGQVKSLFKTTEAAYALLRTATEKLRLSTRAALHILRVARTIADLEQSARLDAQHVAEALQFR